MIVRFTTSLFRGQSRADLGEIPEGIMVIEETVTPSTLDDPFFTLNLTLVATSEALPRLAGWIALGSLHGPSTMNGRELAPTSETEILELLLKGSSEGKF